MLIDEPTASLDKDSADIVMELLKELKNERTTIIGIFHDERLIKYIADKIYRTIQVR